MPAWNTRLSTKNPVASITDAAAAAYRRAYARFEADFRDRMDRLVRGVAAGGSDDAMNRRRIAELRDSMKQLERELERVAPDIAADLGSKTATWVNARNTAWMDGLTTHAPTRYRPRVVDLLSERERYLAKGSLLRKKLEAGLIAKMGPHHQMLARTEALLAENLTSGKTMTQMIDAMNREIFGGQSPIHEVRRLVKTELSDAYHEGRRAVSDDLRAEGLTIGIHVEPELDTDYGLECPVCGPILESATGEGPGDFLFSDGTPPLPPYHPNCDCSNTGEIWAE